MRTLEHEIAVLGGGCIGSSVLYELSRRGFSDLVLIDHGRRTMSATAKSGGMLRVFHESPEHVALALGNFSRFEASCRSGVLTQRREPNGSLYFFNRRRYRDYKINLLTMARADYPFELLTARAGRERFPLFRWREDDWAIYEPLGSHHSPGSLGEDLLNASTRQGADVLDSFEVRRISIHRDRYRLFGSEATLTAKTLILAGGARLIPLLRDLGFDLGLEARRLTSYSARNLCGTESHQNQRPAAAPNYFDRETLEFARLGSGEEVVLSNPHLERIVEPHWGEIQSINSAEDSYAPRRAGLMGLLPGHQRLILATGWGGTAFKFALEVGFQVANIIENELPERRMAYAGI